MIVCHNDATAWNLLRAPEGWSLIDWDAAGPRPAVWDLAYCAVGVVPLDPDTSRLGWHEPVPRAERLRALVHGYGLDADDRVAFPEKIVARIRSSHLHLRRRARRHRAPRRAVVFRRVDQRVSLVTLGVTDVERAKAFYEAVGWKGESPDGEVVFFQAGGMIIALWGRDKLATDSCVTDGGGWGGVTMAMCVASPAEVDRVLVQAEQAGARIGRPGAPTFWGGYSGIFVDPDGHPWEVAQNPGWRLHADGSVTLR
jgi:predicted lactoylglutathione lyase